MTKQKIQISWEAPEYIHYKKGFVWYLSLVLIGAAVLTYAVWNKDYLMLFTLLVVLIVWLVISHQKPRTIKITLSGKGVALSENFYPYSMLKSFWIVYEPPEVKTLYFETTNYLNREIIVQLGEEDPNRVRNFLLQFLPEDLEREESYSDKLLRRLKF